jgi:hypothetical protein
MTIHTVHLSYYSCISWPYRIMFLLSIILVLI